MIELLLELWSSYSKTPLYNITIHNSAIFWCFPSSSILWLFCHQFRRGIFTVIQVSQRRDAEPWTELRIFILSHHIICPVAQQPYPSSCSQSSQPVHIIVAVCQYETLYRASSYQDIKRCTCSGVLLTHCLLDTLLYSLYSLYLWPSWAFVIPSNGMPNCGNPFRTTRTHGLLAQA